VVKPFGITGGDVGSSAGADEHWDLSFLYVQFLNDVNKILSQPAFWFKYLFLKLRFYFFINFPISYLLYIAA